MVVLIPYRFSSVRNRYFMVNSSCSGSSAEIWVVEHDSAIYRFVNMNPVFFLKR